MSGAGLRALHMARGDASDIPFVMATERGAGFEQLVGRWDERRHRAALADARASIGIAARRATRVMTVSESSKRDILRFVDTAPEKIDVIYNAYDERFGIEPREEDVNRVRERFQLHDEFVLYAGNV